LPRIRRNEPPGAPTLDLVPLGDLAWLARFATEAEARRWASSARRAGLAGVVDVVLAYKSASVHFDPDIVDGDDLALSLRGLHPEEEAVEMGRLVTLPVLYDGEDLGDVAALSGLTTDEVIGVHAGTIYDVFAIGFQPGFPYAGYLPDPLDRLPRRAEPRLRVPSGSVAIAAGQTGVYPTELPGGWNLIGRTPLSIVDVKAGRFPIRAGDRLAFTPIDADEFARRLGEPLT
jgi:KipI family sensor histidine kinase inhibitor